MFLFEKAIYTRSFGSVVAHFCKLFAIPKFGNLIHTIPRAVFRGLNTISGCTDIVKFDRIFIGQITAKPIITVVIAGSPCHIHIGSGAGIGSNKRNRFALFQA